MKRILGFYFPDKEERKRREEEVLRHYFRYGEEHKERIGELLQELIPGEKREYLIMYYMQIKEQMEACGTRDFEAAVKQIKRKYIIISVNDAVNRYYKAVMEADDAVLEDLRFPSAEEIRKRVEQHGKDYTV